MSGSGQDAKEVAEGVVTRRLNPNSEMEMGSAREAMAAQRRELIALRERGGITDELAHAIQRKLDPEELGLG